jgi:DNA-binding PadR family transcriptional regulator
MPLKHAVLALVAERRGYGYDLAQRLEQRVGPAWQLNPSAVYPALDQLERAGLVAASTRASGTRRSPRVLYAATPAGLAALEAWLTTAQPDPEPVRSDLLLRLAFARAEHGAALVAELAARERSTAALLARCAADEPPTDARTLVDAAVAIRLAGEVAWLGRTRDRLASAAPLSF